MQNLPDCIGPYNIIDVLGEGGMGIVYRADDTRLNRRVALKMIRPQGSDAPGLRERFLREARTAARVSHPNVCQLYDIGEMDGWPYLVMELLEGESLSVRVGRGPLRVAEAVQVTLGMLAALAALHSRSILHRDLKPSNVFLSTQGVKLLDFGLAKAMSDEQGEGRTRTELTLPGVMAMTPRYASPEQVTAKPMDGRSDLFSTGAVLFEMLTGKYAFTGNSAIEIFHAILYDSPPALGGSPAICAVDRIICRALTKNPQERFSSANEMAAELRAALRLEDAGGRVETRSVKRLIVLPFRALRPDPDTDFLAFSLPDAIAASLAGLNSLVVRSSMAAARFSNQTPDFKEIAREADVDVVLTGTLLRSGSQIRLTTQLVEAPAGTLIWSRALQVELQDIFQLQDTLVSAVVESLALPLTNIERERLSHDTPENPTAYDLYLRANELPFAQIREAIELYRRCVTADPEYAPAWARLGRALWLIDKYDAGSAEKLAEADQALRRALELNPDLPLAHKLYTPIEVEQGHALEAIARLLRRARTAGQDPDLFAGLVHALRYGGLLEASLAAHRQARRLDPHIITTVLNTYFFAGDYQGALDSAGDDDYGYTTTLALAALGRMDDAVRLLDNKQRRNSGRLGDLYLAAVRALVEGDRASSLRATDQLLGATFRDPEGWFYLARQLSYLGSSERALEALGRSIDWGFFCYPALAADPWLDSLRADPEFERILRKAELMHEEAWSVFAREGGPRLLGVPGQRGS